jgi:hypothetical protein
MKKIFFLALALVLAADAHAVIGTAGGPSPFLKMGAGARGLALSGAFTAYDDDASCPYWNPASIGGMKRISVGSMISWMTEDRSNSYLDLVLPMDFGVAAISVLNLSVSNIEGRSSDTPDYYLFSNSDTAFLATFAKQFLDRLSLGCTLKYIYMYIDKYYATGVSADLGVHIKFSDIFSAGVMMADLLNSQTWSTGRSEHILIAMRLGGLAELLDRQLHVSAEMEQLESSEMTAKAGVEGVFMKILSLRAGCSYAFMSYYFDFTLGGGIKYSLGGVLLQADYALVREAFSGSTDFNHKFSLSAYF